MNEETEGKKDGECEQIDLNANTDKPIIIYCHKDSQATININTVHNHCPEWLNLDAVLQIVREITAGNNKNQS